MQKQVRIVRAPAHHQGIPHRGAEDRQAPVGHLSGRCTIVGRVWLMAVHNTVYSYEMRSMGGGAVKGRNKSLWHTFRVCVTCLGPTFL